MRRFDQTPWLYALMAALGALLLCIAPANRAEPPTEEAVSLQSRAGEETDEVTSTDALLVVIGTLAAWFLLNAFWSAERNTFLGELKSRLQRRVDNLYLQVDVESPKLRGLEHARLLSIDRSHATFGSDHAWEPGATVTLLPASSESAPEQRSEPFHATVVGSHRESEDWFEVDTKLKPIDEREAEAIEKFIDRIRPRALTAT